MRTLLQAFGAIAVGCSLITAAHGETGVRWQTDLEAAKKMVAASNRLVLIHFTASWCRWCKPLDQNVFNQDAVARAIESSYVPVKLDFDKDRAVAKQYGINGPPWDVVIMPDGQVVRDFNSPQKPDQYVSRVVEIAQHVRPNGMAVAANNSGAVPAGYAAASADAQGGPQPHPAPRAGWTDNRYSDYRGVQTPIVEPTNPPLANQAPPPAAANYNLPNAFGPAVTPPANQVAPTGPSFDTGNQQSPPAFAPPTGNGPTLGGPAPTNPPPGFGLDGYCPVHLSEKAAWTPGDRRFGAIHRGKTYLFASESCQKKFMADPDRYSPAFGGNDPVILADRNQTVPGRRDIGCFFGVDGNRRIVLFADEASYQAFERNPKRYGANVFAPQP